MMHRIIFVGLLVSAGLLPLVAAAQIPLTIVNSSFETGSPQAVPSGWTPTLNYFWIGNSSYGGSDPSSGYLSPQFASASWQYGGLPNANSLVGGAAYSASIRQDIDLSPYSSQIGQGGVYLGLSYAYFDQDGTDIGTISYNFLDAGGSPVGTGYSGQTTVEGGWQFVENLSAAEVPTSASTLRITLLAQRNGSYGTARNTAFDAISASLQPPPPPETPSGLVNGNLIEFEGNGSWCWYQDERAVVDPNNGHVLVNSVGFSPSYVSGYVGIVDVVNFDPQTGRRVRTQLSNLSGIPSQNIQADDHNVGALLVLPDGRYLSMYANHGNNGGLGDEYTRWRVSNDPGDSTSWTTEQVFNWYNNVPGANETGNENAANVAYHNLFYLSEEDQVYDISRSYGRLSINGASQNMPNIARYDMDTDSVQWAGQLLESEAQGYSAYPKYVSNGADRIYFITTESHPRNYNNSIYAGYIENGQTFDMQGTVIDPNVFDNGTDAGGSGFVADVNDFTLVQQSDPLGEGHNRMWTVDMALDGGGSPMALFTSRWNPDGLTSDGSTPNPIDHRLHYAHWNSQSGQWETHEIAQMGNRLYADEQDYTGLGALVPGDPNTVYISTQYDPREFDPENPKTSPDTTYREIYKGVTADGGATWTWTPVTENSGVHNLRPIVPDPHGGDRTVIWFRGTYATAGTIDAAVVGIVERAGESQGLVNYLDADDSNTRYASGAALQTSTPSGSTGPLDNLWHERTGYGNGGSVLTSSETGFENAPMLKTTIDGAALEDGLYDIFAYFWSDNDEDWRLMAGLESTNLIDFRRYGSQFAEADQFVTIEAVSGNNNDLLLYRAYLGRTEIVGGADIDVFIDDWQSPVGDAIRTWYDGVGYALVSSLIGGLAGDYNEDGIVDAADYTVWRDHFGTVFSLPNRDPNNSGVLNEADFTYWKNNFGNTSSGSLAAVPEPSTGLLLTLAAVLAGLLTFSPGTRARGAEAPANLHYFDASIQAADTASGKAAANTTMADGTAFTEKPAGEDPEANWTNTRETTGSGGDGLWRQRGDAAYGNGPAGNVLESRGDNFGNNSENLPGLKTIVDVPPAFQKGKYSVWVMFWSDGAPWQISASLSEPDDDAATQFVGGVVQTPARQVLEVYDAGDTTTSPLNPDHVAFLDTADLYTSSDAEAASPPTGRHLWAGLLGNVQDIGKTLTVYVGDGPPLSEEQQNDSGNHRTWYDGIAIGPALEP